MPSVYAGTEIKPFTEHLRKLSQNETGVPLFGPLVITAAECAADSYYGNQRQNDLDLLSPTAARTKLGLTGQRMSDSRATFSSLREPLYRVLEFFLKFTWCLGGAVYAVLQNMTFTTLQLER